MDGLTKGAIRDQMLHVISEIEVSVNNKDGLKVKDKTKFLVKESEIFFNILPSLNSSKILYSESSRSGEDTNTQQIQ